MKKIAIIGHGYVGKAMAKYFRDHYPLVVFDTNYAMLPLPGEWADLPLEHVATSSDKESVNTCDLAVVCVPTPMGEDGSVDLSIVESVFEWLKVPLVLVKSTIPPGTCEQLAYKYSHLRIVFSPEYIGEGKYHVPIHHGYPHPTDMKQHEFFVFGGRKPDTSAVINFFMRVSGPSPVYAQTDWRTAELVKYMENSWGAMKVTFCNEFFNIARTFGIDYKELRELFLLDGRTERMHTAVFEDKRGFDGKCYPKDVNGIVKQAEKAGYSADLLKEVLKSNDRIRGV